MKTSNTTAGHSTARSEVMKRKPRNMVKEHPKTGRKSGYEVGIYEMNYWFANMQKSIYTSYIAGNKVPSPAWTMTIATRDWG
jgi:hypothetical protein